eukprot:TRINITY_DN8396_c0_g1_i1.p2 TRINITY_DN8396_c0_g1~~TRINITY_DN8396_c0_g1_i1.p2  ORF type:complete len:230 (-),score=60.52 TRINITY_DN8396_c0_g1_i1:23-712(-)
MGPDHPFYAHEVGLAAALVALDQRGDAAELFRPVAKAFERVLQEALSEAELVHSEPNMTLSSRVDVETGLTAMQTTNLVPGANVQELFRVCHDSALRTRWENQFMNGDKRVVDYKDFNGYVEGTDEIQMFKYPGMMFIKGREFLDRRVTHRDSARHLYVIVHSETTEVKGEKDPKFLRASTPVSYTHLRAHETPEHLVCRLLLEKKKKNLKEKRQRFENNKINIKNNTK